MRGVAGTQPQCALVSRAAGGAQPTLHGSVFATAPLTAPPTPPRPPSRHPHCRDQLPLLALVLRRQRRLGEAGQAAASGCGAGEGLQGLRGELGRGGCAHPRCAAPPRAPPQPCAPAPAPAPALQAWPPPSSPPPGTPTRCPCSSTTRPRCANCACGGGAGRQAGSQTQPASWRWLGLLPRALAAACAPALLPLAPRPARRSGATWRCPTWTPASPPSSTASVSSGAGWEAEDARANGRPGGRHHAADSAHAGATLGPLSLFLSLLSSHLSLPPLPVAPMQPCSTLSLARCWEARSSSSWAPCSPRPVSAARPRPACRLRGCGAPRAASAGAAAAAAALVPPGSPAAMAAAMVRAPTASSVLTKMRPRVPPPCAAAEWFHLLGTSLPAASSFFINYAAIHALAINVFRWGGGGPARSAAGKRLVRGRRRRAQRALRMVLRAALGSSPPGSWALGAIWRHAHPHPPPPTCLCPRFIWPHDGTVLFVLFRAVGLFRALCVHACMHAYELWLAAPLFLSAPLPAASARGPPPHPAAHPACTGPRCRLGRRGPAPDPG